MKQLIDELEGLGFYKYTEPQSIENAKAESVETGYLYVDTTQRDYIADSEDLAEGGVKDFLVSLSPFLERQGVSIKNIEEDFNVGGAYSVTVDDEKFVMYTQEELEEKEIWELTTRRAFSMINTLLRRANSSERIYFLYGGNDTQAIFLTPEMYEVISQSSVIGDDEKPNAAE